MGVPKLHRSTGSDVIAAVSRFVDGTPLAPVQKVDRREFLRRHVVFGELQEKDRDTLLNRSRLRSCAQGEVILERGSQSHGMMIVVRGIVRISTTSAFGNEIVLTLAGPGDIVGEIDIFDGRSSPIVAVAGCYCELLFLDRRDVLSLLRDSAQLGQCLAFVLCQRLQAAIQKIEELRFASVATRLARQLLALKEGQRTEKLSQRDLAERIGVSRESVNKHLVTWRQKGLVEITGRSIKVVDPVSLHHIVEGTED